MDSILPTEMAETDLCSFSATVERGQRQNGVQFSGLHVQINDQQILQDITGFGERGKVTAVMGPSGSGKTTLLNAIAGRQECQSGEITLDGKTVDKSVRRGVSYVLQDDILYENLTLRETVYFAAMMKLPEAMSRVDKMAKIDEVVDALNIRDCLDTIIGSVFVRGLSGGEKKRANIACEIISNPDVLLLDEPTSGLDSYTAYMLMKQLKAYASSMNKVIITTIHQPATQIFNSFNDLLLLAKGKIFWNGGFWMINTLLGAMVSCETAVINKERASGMYRSSAFILAKMTSELPLVIIGPLVCHPIIYWIVGLNPNPANFVLSLVVAMLSAISGQSIGLIISTSFINVDVTLSVGTVYFLSAVYFMGFLSRHSPVWIAWGVYTSVLYYVFRAHLIIEYTSNNPIRCTAGNASIFAECSDHINETEFVPSNYVLELEGIKAPLYCYILSLLGIIIACRVLTYFAFVVFRKPR